MLARLLPLILLLFTSLGHAESLESAIMPGKVIQGHAKYEDECKNCHKRFDKAGQNKLCMDCHKEVGKDVEQKKGFHGRQPADKECRECHTEHKGRTAKVVNLNEKTFKHGETDFALKGGHAAEKVKCEDCHKPKVKWRDAPHLCVDCHKKDDDKAHKGNLGKDCAKCHGADGKGNQQIGAPNLTDNIWLYGGSVPTIMETINKGRGSVSTVTRMPAHKELLDAGKIQLLTAYVWGLSHPDNAKP